MADRGIYKRDDGWEASVVVDGKRRWKSFTRKAEAKAWRESQLVAGRRGEWVDPRLSAKRLGGWLLQWLELKRPTWSEGSYTRYESIVRVHLVPEFGGVALGDLTPMHVQRWVNGMEPSTAHSTFPVLRMALAYAKQMEQVPKNVCALVDLPSYEARRRTFLEPDELRELVGMIDEQWFSDIVLGLAFTGARIGEFAAITAKDINPMKGTIDLYATKTKSSRTIGIAPPLEEVIERRLSLGHDTVWGMQSGTPIAPANLRARHWHPLRESAGLDDLRLHDLRHTCASWLIKSGASIPAVCAWLGHSKPTQTLNTYAHLFADDMSESAVALGEMWDSKPSTNVVEFNYREGRA